VIVGQPPAIAPLAMGEVHVWYRVTDTIADTTSALDEESLSADECARRDRFHAAADRRDYAIAHGLLRRSLSRYAPVPPHRWRFASGANGKPFINDGCLSFNLSHTRGLVACTVAHSTPLGIDVERINRVTDVESLADRFFSHSETAALCRGAADVHVRFIDLWTLKEAFVKATGRGLSQPLDSFSFDLDYAGRRIGFAAPPGYDAAEWRFALYAPQPKVRLAVAAHARRLQDIRWQAYEVHVDEPARVTPILTSHL
jgi:4'-phosphopantetheinyl transferase